MSGVQPTGDLHLGNYLGAVKRFATMQDDFPIFCIVDLHAMTQRFDPEKLRQNTLRVAATYLACGIDHSRSIIFPQSGVRQHAELGWILQCVARVGWLDRMTQFREKAGVGGANRENVSVGLYSYPVLQAADILLYRATHVPVGDDQKQHLNLARDIAAKFNNDFCPEFFPLPKAMIAETGARIMSLKTGLTKMSKSDEDDSARINLSDSNDVIARKIKRATASTEPMPDTLEVLKERPPVLNLVTIYGALSDRSVDDVLAEFAGKGFGVFKPALAELAISVIEPIREETDRYLADPGHLLHKLNVGRHWAAEIAEDTMTGVRLKTGMFQ
jgi:tryptophanyl-tRNA synthetase